MKLKYSWWIGLWCFHFKLLVAVEMLMMSFESFSKLTCKIQHLGNPRNSTLISR